MPHPRAVIFDMDGVLVLTERPHFDSWQLAANARNITLDYPAFLATFGRISTEVVPALFGPHVPPGALTPEVITEIADEKERLFRDLISREVPLAPGVPELLRELAAAGVLMGVGSSGPPENVNLVLDAGHIRPYFNAVVTGADVRRGKPAPDVFLLAAERLGVVPARCAVIEDAPAGISAAVAAGMLPVALTTSNPESALRAAGASHVFPSIESLRNGALISLLPT